MKHTLTLLTALLFTSFAPLHAADDPGRFPVSITIDASKPMGELKPVWRFFGADQPNLATMNDGKKLLGELPHCRKRGSLANLLQQKSRSAMAKRRSRSICRGKLSPWSS